MKIKWIHSRLNTTIEECTASLDQYKFNRCCNENVRFHMAYIL
nr:class I tRNA ligase family protein [Candidatus Kuenenia stuttgartiensis]